MSTAAPATEGFHITRGDHLHITEICFDVISLMMQENLKVKCLTQLLIFLSNDWIRVSSVKQIWFGGF